MSDTRPPEFAPRRPRIGMVAILVGLALLIGIALMIYAVQTSGGWFSRTPTKPVPAEATIEYNPAPPQSTMSAAAAAVDPATLESREIGLAAQLAALEARTAAVSIDASAASGQAGRAEAILIAFAARRAIERGMPLGYLEEELRRRFGAAEPRATLVITESAHDPLTLEDLRQGLDANAAELLSAKDEDLLSSLSRELRSLIVIHDAGTPSPILADRLKRARRMLDAGQVGAALAEVQRLPGAGQAGAWIAAARRYIETRGALDEIESAAVLGRTSPVIATPAAPQPLPAAPPQ